MNRLCKLLIFVVCVCVCVRTSVLMEVSTGKQSQNNTTVPPCMHYH